VRGYITDERDTVVVGRAHDGVQREAIDLILL
jgi:hypothetical protein